jgi:hypothetical protein
LGLLSYILRLHSFNEIKCFKFCYPADLIFNHISVNEKRLLPGAIGEINHVGMLGHEVFQKGDERGYTRAAGQKHHIARIPNHKITVGHLNPDPPAFMKFILHAGGVASPDGIGDPKIIPLGRGAGDGENPGFGPETAGIVVIQRQVKELAGLEAGHGPLGRKINGIDVIAVIGDFIYQATEFLRGHWVIGFVEFMGFTI